MNEPTKEQKEFIWEKFESGIDDIKTLTGLFVDEFFSHEPENMKDGRSKYGRAIKSMLAEKNEKARGAHEYQAKEKIELTKEQEEFALNNASLMSFNEIAKVLFENQSITPLYQESRAVKEFLESQEDSNLLESSEDLVLEGYKPPKTEYAMVCRVNKYVHEGLNKDNLTPKDKKDIKSLIGYLNIYRFLHQINTYNNNTNRELFESSFIRYTHDKSDLTQEEVDQYIVLSGEVVIAANIQRRVERLQELLDASAEDTEGRRIAMSLVDAISTAQTEYNQCVNRQHKLLGDLKEKRSEKLKKQLHENASVLNLVELWKEEEGRKKLLKLAEIKKKSLSDETERLSDMDEVKCRILGLDKDSIL